MIYREELICSGCGKVRLLSADEANEDGWMASKEGPICPCCNQLYGIPLDGPPHPTKDDLAEAERLRRFASKLRYVF